MQAPFRVAFALIVLLLLMSACDDARGDDLLFGDRLYSRSANGIFVVDKNGVKWEVAPGVMLVRFSPSSSPAQIGEFADSHGLTLRQHPANSSGYLLFDYEEGRDAVEILTDLLNDPAVLDACPDTKVRLFAGMTSIIRTSGICGRCAWTRRGK